MGILSTVDIQLNTELAMTAVFGSETVIQIVQIEKDCVH
jgi:hypothetical protein